MVPSKMKIPHFTVYQLSEKMKE